LSGQDGDDAAPYQERDLQDATKRLREVEPRRNREDNVDERVNAANTPDPEWEKVRRCAMVIEWSDEDQLFLVSNPDFPGAHTHGRSRAEAAAMGEEIIALLLDGEVKPPPTRFTAMSHPIRPEADVGEFITAGTLR
jgi:predicted RNase H-like HicB family nuclease